MAFFIVRNVVNLLSFNSGGIQEFFGKGAGTENIASAVGMAAALSHCHSLIEKTGLLYKLEARLLSVLNNAKTDYLRNGAPLHIPGNISLSFKGFQGKMLLHRLDLIGICVSTGSACDSKNIQISYVLKQ